MFTVALRRSRAPIGGAPVVLPAIVARGPHVAVGRARGDAERVRDRSGGGDLVVTHEAGEDREAGGVGGGPAVGAPRVGREVERGARAGFPARVGGVPACGPGLEEEPMRSDR